MLVIVCSSSIRDGLSFSFSCLCYLVCFSSTSFSQFANFSINSTGKESGGGSEGNRTQPNRQTISYTQKLNRFSAGSIIRRAAPGLIWKNVFPARNKQNLLSNTHTHTQIHANCGVQCWVYSAGIKKVICYCFLSCPRISL